MSENKKSKTWILFLMIFIAITLWFANLIVVIQLFPASEEDRGLFGDMFGAVSALFAGLAFAGLIYAIYLQKQELSVQHDELKLNRKELELTRIELEGQKEQLKAQNETWQRQIFENTFFQLLALYNHLVRDMEIQVMGPALKGKTCLQVWFSHFVGNFNITVNETGINDLSEAIHLSYSITYKKQKINLSPYFRTLYNILKFVKRSDIGDKKFYSSLLRAQLTNDELLLIFYNCLCPLGEKFKPLVEEYGLLKHLEDKTLIKMSHKEHYNQSAFE